MNLNVGKEIKERSFLLRGELVMLDIDVAKLYETSLTNINRAVGRRKKRFPIVNRFQLTEKEYTDLVVTHPDLLLPENKRKEHFAFNKKGIYQVSFVLNNEKAIMVADTFIRDVVEMGDLSFEKILNMLEKTKEKEQI